MNIVIAGGTGLIGRALSVSLLKDGYTVTILTRAELPRSPLDGVKYIRWGEKSDAWIDELTGVEAIINLAGENIGSGRWTATKKKKILDSRVNSGKMLVRAIENLNTKPEIFIQSSAIGIYGTNTDQVFSENSPTGNDYLAGIAKIWEDSSKPVDEMGVKRAVIRTGVVLDKNEGALARMILPFKLFMGGPIGSGKQWLSWIHLQDEVEAIKFILERKLTGIFNLTSPNPVQNAEMGMKIGNVLHRPYWMPVPALALRAVLGEMSTLVLDGQKVIPDALLSAGFTFKYPLLYDALQNIFDAK